MKKTKHTLRLVLSASLLLVSIAVSAQAQAIADFTGTWNTVTDKGKKIVITLEQRRTIVTGSYLPMNALSASYKPSDGSISGFVKVSAYAPEPALQSAASISGTVKDNVLTFMWRQDDGNRGAGRFTMSSDNQSFEGRFSATRNPEDPSGGSWNGKRAPSFTGAWQGRMGDSNLMLIIQQTGGAVAGQVKVNSADIGFIREANISGDTLRFKIVRAGLRIANGMMLPDQYVGFGELVMDEGGKSLKGTVLSQATNLTLLGR